MGNRATIAELTSLKQGVVPAVQAAGTIDGTGVSRRGFNEVLIALSIGVATDDAATLDVKLQESATVGGTYTDVPSGALPQKLGTADNTITELRVNLDDVARLEFIRIRSVAAGTASFARSVDLVLARPHQQPAT